MEGKSLLFLLCLLATQESEGSPKEKVPRIGIFNIVEFPNSNCVGDNRNGTCYTKEECAERNGLATSACADGYGVCCVVSLACGATSAENITYLQSNDFPTNCEYTICPCNSNVCRIRFDFESFTIAPPFPGDLTADATNNGLHGGAIGDCVTDTFQISGSQYSSPQICGINTGQHVFADVGSGCVKPAFRFGNANNAPQRAYRIKITQYTCNHEMAGPAGCLQYFTGEMGRVASFNFPLTATTIPMPTTIVHLSDQNYDICFRRAAGRCRLCFTPSIETTLAGGQTADPNLPASFGLGVTAAAGNHPVLGNSCSEDYLIIPQGKSSAALGPGVLANNAQANLDKICGRRFSTFGGGPGEIPRTICTARVPFSIKFRTDQDETVLLMNPMAKDSENFVTQAKQGLVPGFLGFSLDFLQEQC